jgi:hypothetical protein
MHQYTAYYMDKRTGTLADVLAAWGLAGMLHRLLDRVDAPGEVTLRDVGPCYAVELSQPIEEAWLDQDVYFDLFPFFDTGTAKGMPPGMHPVVDYPAEQERVNTYFEMRRNLPTELRRPDAPDDHPAIQAMNQYKPRPHWPIWAALRPMRAVDVYNKLAAWWFQNRKHAGELLRIILTMCAEHPNRVEEAEAAWKALKKTQGLAGEDRVTAVQLFNPGAAKGANAPKPSGPGVGGLKSFWLLELLKVLGMYEAGLPLGVQGVRDRKSYVLVPLEMEMSAHRAVFKDFRSTLFSRSAIKMDILASLRYTRAFLRHCEANREGSLAQRFFGRGPQHFVAGLAVAFYKDMGQALAVLNQSQINLPGWIQVSTPDEIKDWLDVLEEHEQVIRPLDEGQGEGYTLLSVYRDFLSARDLEPFWEFTGHYAGYRMSRMERRQWAPPFTTENLRRVIMGTERKLKPILDSPGFQNVAYAIRHSTVIPQYRKGRGEARTYDIRYGLGAELKRKANYADEFIQALSDFMQSYNQENAQIAETRGVQYRRNLTTDDVQQIVALVDEYGAKTVGNLLVAYGYAREPREELAEPTPEVEEEEGGAA